jgi:hypothetical protein
VFVAASDYLKVLPDAIDQWLPKKLHGARDRRNSAAAIRARHSVTSSRSIRASSSSPRCTH